MLVLEKRDGKVYCDGVELKINPQSSKGPGKEVVKVEGLPGSNGQTWVSLSRLKEGFNEIETQKREISSYQKYNLTQEEKDEIKLHQSIIDEIINNAKSRYVPKMDYKKLGNQEYVNSLTDDQLEYEIQRLDNMRKLLEEKKNRG